MSTVRTLNDGLKEIASKELNEVENRITEDVEALKLWIEKQFHLRAYTDDQYLLTFLRGSKHSLEKAKSKIDYFYTIKTMMPELFRNKRMSGKLLELARQGVYTWLPLTENSSSPNISIVRFENFDSKRFKLFDIFKYRMCAMEYFLKESDNCMVAGYVEIIDLSNIPYSLYAQIDLALMKKLSVFGKKALPIRYKGIHLLNFKTELNEIFNFVKTLLIEKYRKRLYVHRTLAELYEHIPRHVLPKEYGGTNGTMADIVKDNLKKMLQLNDFLVEDDCYGVDERLRPNNKRSLDLTINKSTMSSTVRSLNDALKSIAQQELNEIEERIPEYIAALKDWLEKQPHLRARTEDQYLVAFLRGSKYSLEKAKSKIDYFYTIKTMMPEFFRNRKMNEKFCEFVHAGNYLWTPIPPNASWPNLSIVRFKNFDMERFKLMDIMAYRAMVMEHSLTRNDNSIVAGHVDILDLANASSRLYLQANVVTLKKFGVFVEKALPIRFKGVHIINCPKELFDLLKIGKGLITEKYRNRFYVHKRIEELYEFVPRERLPVEYGGTNGTIRDIAKYNEEQLKGMNDFFMEDDLYGVDERLRPTNTKLDDTTLFGLEGSFKKLDID